MQITGIQLDAADNISERPVRDDPVSASTAYSMAERVALAARFATGIEYGSCCGRNTVGIRYQLCSHGPFRLSKPHERSEERGRLDHVRLTELSRAACTALACYLKPASRKSLH